MGDGDAAFGFELESALEKANALILGKGVLPAMGIDKARGEGFGCGNLFAERLKVVRDGLAVGEDLGDELQTVLLEQGAKPLPIFVRGHWALYSPVAGLLEFREELFPLACCAPKVAEKNQLHAPLYFAHYLPNASGRAGSICAYRRRIAG